MTHVALIGLGTIGTGVANILLGHADRITKATGRKVVLSRICDKDTTTRRDIDLPPGVLTDDFESVVNDPDISVAVELIGGLEPARTFVSRLLQSGKNVVTANKALLAQHGEELFDTARKCGRTIAFEAAVCGGIPILGSLATSLQANRFQSIHAIVNGTSNYILSQMNECGTDYAAAVKEAQRLGYAEANPAMDVDGTDAVQKLSILAQLGFGARVNWREIPRTGIEAVEAIDFRYARELGYRIKLIAVAAATDGGLELHVAPTLVRESDPLARVDDAFNAVRVCGDYVGPVFFHGLGAGRRPTASAVVGDLIDTILGRTAITFETLGLWSERRNGIPVKNPENIYGKSFLRMSVEDRPGVLHDIAGVFGQHGISIASLIQHEPDNVHADSGKSGSGKPPVSLILTTHEAREGNMLQAITALEELSCTLGPIARMRVLD